MDVFTYFYLQMDKMLLPVYRVSDNHFLGYYLGTFVLAVICVIVGEFSISLAFRANRERIIHNGKEMSRFQELSIDALRAGQKAAYRASNLLANEAFGKSFFQMVALSAASLWPVFFALAWLQYRFTGVELPLPVEIPVVGRSIGYVGSFALIYVLARIVSNNIKLRVLSFWLKQKDKGPNG